MLNLQQKRKNARDKISQNVCKLWIKLLLSDVFNLQKVTFFHFYPTDLVNTKITIPLRVAEQRWIYTSTLRVSVYPAPLFTSPSEDSCLIFTLFPVSWAWNSGHPPFAKPRPGFFRLDRPVSVIHQMSFQLVRFRQGPLGITERKMRCVLYQQ